MSHLFVRESAIVLAQSAVPLVRAAALFVVRSASVVAPFAEGLINASVTLSIHAVDSLVGASSVSGIVYLSQFAGGSQDVALASKNISVLLYGASLVASVRKWATLLSKCVTVSVNTYVPQFGNVLRLFVGQSEGCLLRYLMALGIA